MSDTQSADVRVFERPADGLTEIISGKLHGIRVTESKLNYHGSITIDTDILEAAHMLPLEFVYIWNKATGERISTYVLPGERGSGVCCLNGAAARTCQVDDELIVTSSLRIPGSALTSGFNAAPRAVMFRHEPRVNTISEVLAYHARVENGVMRFSMEPVD